MQPQKNPPPVIVRKADINTAAKEDVKELQDGGSEKKDDELIPIKYRSRELLQQSLDRNLQRLALIEKRLENKLKDVADRKRWLELLNKKQG